MKKVATKTLASLVQIGTMNLRLDNISVLMGQSTRAAKQQLKRLERVYQRYDRKHELRADLLGVAPDELRRQLKRKSFETIVKKYGFKNLAAFYIALTGKLKTELKRRGWTEQKIEERIQRRLARLGNSSAKLPAFSV